MTWMRMTLLALTVSLAGRAAAQAPPEPEPDIAVDITVNFDGNYRDGTWAPVDVTVINSKANVTGYVEVKTFIGEEVQSPIYRLPVESPRSSKKRFRLYVYLSGATRIEAQLLNESDRAVLEAPPWMTLQPMAQSALMALVLDDNAGDYGFVNAVLSRKGEQRSLYRKQIRTEDLELIPDHAKCFDAYDLVLIGNVDLGQMSQRQQVLIESYVQRGGVVAVCLGGHTAKLRIPWLQELAGIDISGTSTHPEGELLRTVFGDEGPRAPSAESTLVLANMVPKDFAMQIKGGQPAFGVLRPLGRGFVATFAPDVNSPALRGHPGYQDMWYQVCTHKNETDALHYEAAANAAVTQLPHMADIRLFSKASVMLYLALYFGIGIVGNWVVCSLLKRREWAWFLLVLFSAGFTAYAMIFGTAGRAKESKMHLVQTLRIPRDGRLAELHSVVGLLSARSARYDVDFKDPSALVRDAHSITPERYSQGIGSLTPRPFHFIEGRPPRIERLDIGASELRVVQVQSEHEMDGGIVAAFRMDDAGVLTGQAENKTGIVLKEAYLFTKGRLYPLERSGDLYTLPPSSLEAPRPLGQPLLNYRGYYRYDALPPTKGEYREAYLANMLAGLDPSAGIDFVTGPFFVGWCDTPIEDVLDLNIPIEDKTQGTLVIADLALDASRREAADWRPVAISRNARSEYAIVDPVLLRSGREGFHHHRYSTEGDYCWVGLPGHLAQRPETQVRITLLWPAGFTENPKLLRYTESGSGASLSALSVEILDMGTVKNDRGVFRELHYVVSGIATLFPGETSGSPAGAPRYLAYHLDWSSETLRKERLSIDSLVTGMAAEVSQDPDENLRGAWTAWQ